MWPIQLAFRFLISCRIFLCSLHRANDAWDGSSSYSNRRDQSGLNGCCTAMWKANGKTTTLSLFVNSLFPKTEISYMRDASSGKSLLNIKICVWIFCTSLPEIFLILKRIQRDNIINVRRSSSKVPLIHVRF